MKNILVFGDSNTWGYDPKTTGRHEFEDRYPGVVSKLLGHEFRVIEEGLNGRTTMMDDPIDGADRNGMRYFEPCLKSHKPIDLVVIMLGTNDLKYRFSLSAFDIAAGGARLVEHALASQCGPGGNPPQVLLISPIHIHDQLMSQPYGLMFGLESIEKSKALGEFYRINAGVFGCHYLDASLFAKPSPVDCIHMEPEEHKKLGAAIANKILTDIF